MERCDENAFIRLVSKPHSACLLRAARDIKSTHNVHTDNLSTGLLDLAELPRRELRYGR